MGPVVRTVMPNRPSCTEPNQHDAGHDAGTMPTAYTSCGKSMFRNSCFQEFEEIRETAGRQIAARPS